jgi:adenosine kinase
MRIVVAGSVAFDHIMSIPQRFADYIMPDKIHILNISFDVDRLRKSFGGNGANIAYGLGMFKQNPLLVASVGKDFGDYGQWLTSHGVDIGGIKHFKDVLTASGFVVTDKDDNQIWSFYRGAMEKDRQNKLIKLVGKEDLLFMTSADYLAMEKHIDEAARIGCRYIFDPVFQIPLIAPTKLRKGIKIAEVIMGNDYEIELLFRRAKVNLKDVVAQDKIVVTTLGAKGSVITTKEKTYNIPPAKPKNTSDPTGAGDAYRAGFMAAYIQELPFSVCGRLGSVVAAYAVETLGCQEYQFSLKDVKNRYQINFGDSLNI